MLDDFEGVCKVDSGKKLLEMFNTLVPKAAFRLQLNQLPFTSAKWVYDGS